MKNALWVALKIHNKIELLLSLNEFTSTEWFVDGLKDKGNVWANVWDVMMVMLKWKKSGCFECV